MMVVKAPALTPASRVPAWMLRPSGPTAFANAHDPCGIALRAESLVSLSIELASAAYHLNGMIAATLGPQRALGPTRAEHRAQTC